MNIKKIYILLLLISLNVFICITAVQASSLVHTHKWVWVTDTAATCTTKGSKHSECTCGTPGTTEEIPAKGHDYGSWYNTTDPTCLSKGKKRRDCKDCSHYETGDVDALGHDYSYTFVDSDVHLTKCKRTGCTNEFNEAHSITGGGSTKHSCSKCKQVAGDNNNWPSYHYFSDFNQYCGFSKCSGAYLTVKFNYESLPTQPNYYMIGSGKKDWEKSLSSVSGTASYTPYSNAANTTYLPLSVQLESFTHGNWAQHASAWADTDTDVENKAVTQWPADNIKKRFIEWKNIGDTWLSGSSKTLTLTRSGSTYTYSGSMPNGHWKIAGYKGAFSSTTYGSYYLFLNGSCTPYNPTKIRAVISVGYRDRNGNKITGAPSDIRTSKVVWTDKDQKASYSATADNTKLDGLGWRYVGYKIYKQYNIPSNVDGGKNAKTGTKATVNPKLGDQVYSIVFIYEPVKVKVAHRHGTTSSYTVINSNKNKTYDLPDLIQGDAKITSFSKMAYPGYILNQAVVGRNSKKVATTWSTNEKDIKNIEKYTTRLPNKDDSEEVQKKIDQKVIAITNKAPIKSHKVGYGKDITVDFYYSSLKLTVEHRNINGTLIKDKKNKVDLKYTKTLNGHKVNEPSLTVDGETHTFCKKINNKTVEYMYEGVIRKVEIYKDNTLLATLGNDVIGYESFWIYSTNNVGNQELLNVKREIAKMQSNITIVFYYQQIPLLTVRHVEDTDGLQICLPEKILMETSDNIEIGPKDFSDLNYVYITFINESGATKKKEDCTSADYSITNTGISKTVIFVYKYDDPDAPVTPNPGEFDPTEEKVILRSNKRGDEEYNVDVSIPTSEDLYANVIANSFDLKKNIQEVETSSKVTFNLYGRYYSSIDEEVTVDNVEKISIGQITVNEFKYEYWSAEGTVLKNIEKAIVKNEVIYADGKVGEVTIYPSDAYKNGLPRFDYTPGGKLQFNTAAIPTNVYAAKAGFYNAKTDKNGNITVDVLLDEEWYNVNKKNTKPTSTQLKEVKQKYENDPNLLLDLAQNDSKTKVTSDKLSVVYGDQEFKIMNGVSTQLGKDYTVKELMELGIAYINAQPNLVIGNDDLYRKDGIYVRKDIANNTAGGYKTTADVYYEAYEMIKNSSVVIPAENEVETTTRELEGNPVKVHTPVVNYGSLELDENNEYKQLVSNSNNVIVMGETFTIKIPHGGQHRDIDGYGDKDYNYNGLKAEDGGLFDGNKESFAAKKLIKFEFGVIYDGSYKVANEWFELPKNTEEYDFIIPTWEDEKWNGQTVKIYTKVVAENATSDNAPSAEKANIDSSKYVATKNFTVKIIGRMYDLQIRATNDTGYANLNTGDATKGLTANRFPLGEVGTNTVTAYKYGLKLGAKVFFDLKVNGSTGQTSEKIVATPRYFYVSKNGDNLQEVDLYYHTNTQRYVKMAGTNAIEFKTKMTQNNGTKYFANYNTNLGLTSQILKNLGITVNYASEFIDIGNSSGITLENKTRIVAYRTPAELIQAVFGAGVTIANVPGVNGSFPTDNDVINSIGRWYGEFRIPSSTIVAKVGTDPKVVTNVLKNGYIIVAFDNLQTLNGSTPYLSYEKQGSDGKNQWGKEEYSTSIKLPNGLKTITFPESNGYAMAIYETDIKLNNDFETVGTH